MIHFINKLDRKTKVLIGFAVIIGALTAIAEYFFIGALQLFLTKIELIVGNDKLTGIFKSTSIEVCFYITLFAAFTRSFFQGLKIYISRYTQASFANYLRNKIVRYSLKKNSNLSTGKVVSMLSDDLQRASNSILNFSSLVISLFTALTLLFFIIKDSFQIFGISLLILLILFMPQLLINKIVKNSGTELSDIWTSSSNMFLNSIRNKFYLVTYGLVNNEVTSIKKLLKNYLSTYKKTFAVISIKTSYITFIGTLTVLIVSYFQYQNQLIEDKTQLITFLYLFLRFSQSLAQSNTIKTEFQINAASLEGLFTELSKKTQSIDYKSESISELEMVSINNLSFGYNQNLIFENINFIIKPGEPIGVTGESGSGKSTLLSLILGLLEPNKGSILLNNNLKTSNADNTYLNQIAYIGPVPYLIEGSIKDNLLYANNKASNVTKEKIQEALKIAKLNDHIESLPEGLDSKVSEDIKTFSTGQKQRLMIARAILRNPKFIIMDEATSNLDDETEQFIIEKLNTYFQDRLAIIVTHKKIPLSICTKKISL